MKPSKPSEIEQLQAASFLANFLMYADVWNELTPLRPESVEPAEPNDEEFE